MTKTTSFVLHTGENTTARILRVLCRSRTLSNVPLQAACKRPASIPSSCFFYSHLSLLSSVALNSRFKRLRLRRTVINAIRKRFVKLKGLRQSVLLYEAILKPLQIFNYCLTLTAFMLIFLIIKLCFL